MLTGPSHPPAVRCGCGHALGPWHGEGSRQLKPDGGETPRAPVQPLCRTHGDGQPSLHASLVGRLVTLQRPSLRWAMLILNLRSHRQRLRRAAAWPNRGIWKPASSSLHGLLRDLRGGSPGNKTPCSGEMAVLLPTIQPGPPSAKGPLNVPSQSHVMTEDSPLDHTRT